MKIVADAAIPFARHYLGALGELRLVEARAMDRRALQDADVLVVRTATRIDAGLLGGSRVRFVASPASGVDHVDQDYLAAAGIGYAGARGCNARSVAEYVLSALCALAERGRELRRGMVAGVVGCGAVGERVAGLLEAAGFECLRNDPPLYEAGREPRHRELHELLQADILTLHVPLTDSGRHPTRGLLDEARLSRLKPGAILINTSRGDVVDEAALCRWLGRDRRAAAVLDVWSGEPEVDPRVHGLAAIGTPHIAGYSLDARMRGTAMIARRLREFLRLDQGEVRDPPLPPPAAELAIAPGAGPLQAMRQAVLGAYDVRRDAEAWRGPAADRAGSAQRFSSLREQYPARREFPAFTVRVSEQASARLLGGIGFGLTGDA